MIDSCFTSSYRKIAKIQEICKLEDIKNAVSGQISGDNYKERLDKKAEQFITGQCKCHYNVMEVASKNHMGNTLGEKATVFYKYITQEANRKSVYFIDQPEDNLSNLHIINDLFQSLKKLRDKSQLIFVTHNPLLVINLDVDNVIYLEKKNNKINVKNGCLEYDNILSIISKNMDGGVEALKRRIKIYGKQNN